MVLVRLTDFNLASARKYESFCPIGIGIVQQSLGNRCNTLLLNLVEKIAPPKSSIAFISDLKFPLVEIHSASLLANVTYFGDESEVLKFQKTISIQDLSTNLTISGSRNRTIFTISGSRNLSIFTISGSRNIIYPFFYVWSQKNDMLAIIYCSAHVDFWFLIIK